jgi:hypothetical protein
LVLSRASSSAAANSTMMLSGSVDISLSLAIVVTVLVPHCRKKGAICAAELSGTGQTSNMLWSGLCIQRCTGQVRCPKSGLLAAYCAGPMP